MGVKKILVFSGLGFLTLGLIFSFVKPVLTGAAIGSVSLGVGSLSSFTVGVLSLLAASLRVEDSDDIEGILERKAKREKILKKMREASTAEAIGSCLKVYFKGKQANNKKAEKILTLFKQGLVRRIEKENDIEQLKKLKAVTQKALKLSQKIDMNRENKEILRSLYSITNQKLLQKFYA